MMRYHLGESFDLVLVDYNHFSIIERDCVLRN